LHNRLLFQKGIEAGKVNTVITVVGDKIFIPAFSIFW